MNLSPHRKKNNKEKNTRLCCEIFIFFGVHVIEEENKCFTDRYNISFSFSGWQWQEFDVKEMQQSIVNSLMVICRVEQCLHWSSWWEIWRNCSRRRACWLWSCPCICQIRGKNSSSHYEHWSDCMAGIIISFPWNEFSARFVLNVYDCDG